MKDKKNNHIKNIKRIARIGAYGTILIVSLSILKETISLVKDNFFTTSIVNDDNDEFEDENQLIDKLIDSYEYIKSDKLFKDVNNKINFLDDFVVVDDKLVNKSELLNEKVINENVTNYELTYKFNNNRKFYGDILTDKNILIAREIFTYLKSKGFSDSAALGIIGNCYCESKFDIACRTPKAIGLFQNESGTPGYEKAQEIINNIKNSDRTTPIRAQVDNMLYYFEKDFDLYTNKVYQYSNGVYTWWPDDISFEDFKNCNNPYLATEIHLRNYERAGSPNLDQRLDYAWTFGILFIYHGLMDNNLTFFEEYTPVDYLYNYNSSDFHKKDNNVYLNVSNNKSEKKHQ